MQEGRIVENLFFHQKASLDIPTPSTDDEQLVCDEAA